MAASPSSGKFLPAGFAASYLKVMVDVLGRHGADAVLRRAGLEVWIGATEASLTSESLDFAQASAWLRALEETLGARGARGLARRMGAAAFDQGLRPVGAVAAMRDPSFQAFPVDRRVRGGLYSLCRLISSMTSAAVTTNEVEGGLVVGFDPCPDCWNRTAPDTACSLTLGMLSAAAAWIAPEAGTHVEETGCIGRGATACEFRVAWEAGE